jgi:hypothetical protein
MHLALLALGLLAQTAAAPPPAKLSAVPRKDEPRVFALVSFGSLAVELYDPRVSLSPELKAALWSAPPKPHRPGTGSSLSAHLVEGPALRELLAALGLKEDEDLFVKTFKPDAGDKVYRIPVKEIAQLTATFAGKGGGVGESPKALGKAKLASIAFDVSERVPGSYFGWSGVAWPAHEDPFGKEATRNFTWAPSAPLFPNSAVAWLGEKDQVSWEAAALDGEAAVVRALAADGTPIGLYLKSGERVWRIYHFSAKAPPNDPDHERPDPEPALLPLGGGFRFLLQIGDAGSSFAHLVLIDAAHEPREVALRWGRRVSTGE